ncbi:hypothetical protein [Glaciecola petra]|uniref:Uncharacterized protein n=1 Tax=Glaciecola petra TaxID=3075602 RepID=A0ABU2ZNP0_9ALTE|nr:hypothetical protein [Aestuariibacter sp. P117]MDT0594239.1 hypothetical protein [Aestuariibacter sp. P117]
MKAEKLQSIEQLPFPLKALLSEDLLLTQSKNKNNMHYWIISLVIHVFLFILAIYFIPSPKKIENIQPSIQTYLVKIKSKTTKSIDKTELSNKGEQEDKIEIETSDSAIDSNEQVEIGLQPPINETIDNPVSNLNNDPADFSKTDKSQTNSIRKSITKALLQQYVNDEAKKLGQQSAKAFQDAKTSPTINTITSKDTWEIPDEIAPTLVDCQDTAKKSLAIIATFTGGNFGCLDNSNFQQFIDKHKNKGVIAKPETNNK